MVQKFMDAANILKAKFKKDELEQSLVQATSEQNWQTPTNLLHQISNAAYNYQKCQQILQFLFDKLRKKPSWRKVLKSLNLVQFLLKNGPPNLVGLFKQEQYTIKSLQDYSHMSDNIDRGQPVRERAKAIVQLLNNQQLLQQQRTNAKNIRQKMSGIVANYSSGADSKYKGYDSKNYNKSNNRAGIDTNNKLNSAYGDYTYNKSTLDKYKDKQQKKTEGSKTQPSKNTEQVIKNYLPQQPNVIQENKKPFQKQAPKLGKPGQKKSQTQTPNIIEADFPQESKKQDNNNVGNDIFDFVEPPKPSQITNSSNKNLASNPIINPLYSQAPSLAPPQASPPQSFNNFNFNNNLYNGGQNIQSVNFVNPMYSTTAPMVASSMSAPNSTYDQTGLFSMQLNTNTGLQANLAGPVNPAGGSHNLYQQQTAPQNQNSWNFNFSQNSSPYMNVSPTMGGSGSQQFQGHNPAGISLGTSNKNNDQFGDFNSGQKSNNKAGWLSQSQKGLIDFSDFGKQLKKPSSGASGTAASNVGWDW